MVGDHRRYRRRKRLASIESWRRGFRPSGWIQEVRRAPCGHLIACGLLDLAHLLNHREQALHVGVVLCTLRPLRETNDPAYESFHLATEKLKGLLRNTVEFGGQ